MLHKPCDAVAVFSCTAHVLWNILEWHFSSDEGKVCTNSTKFFESTYILLQFLSIFVILLDLVWSEITKFFWYYLWVCTKGDPPRKIWRQEHKAKSLWTFRHHTHTLQQTWAGKHKYKPSNKLKHTTPLLKAHDQKPLFKICCMIQIKHVPFLFNPN